MRHDERERVREIIRILTQRYPGAKTSLNFSTPFQLLIATILAAQCTDAKVNEVTKTLFKKYPEPSDFANADPGELEADIRPTGFFRQKAKAIIQASQDIVSDYGGKLPDDMEELTELRGVGRKTANVVLGSAFGKPAVIVDTHVLRISGRLRLTDPRYAEKKQAEKVEQDLIEIVPREDWTLFSHMLVALGREICTAKKPKHDICPIIHLCPTGQADLLDVRRCCPRGGRTLP
ncbi:MAG TPA: endonuclease III [Armatimonadota bacterium]|nr:endonuclease III [Armatimonadota bacterium]